MNTATIQSSGSCLGVVDTSHVWFDRWGCCDRAVRKLLFGSSAAAVYVCCCSSVKVLLVFDLLACRRQKKGGSGGATSRCCKKGVWSSSRHVRLLSRTMDRGEVAVHQEQQRDSVEQQQTRRWARVWSKEDGTVSLRPVRIHEGLSSGLSRPHGDRHRGVRVDARS
ncbi:hypothetical protein L6452_27049 [Arctium lappa]|uniref:Uncharacterized protein n=1 Tax=Arctium lappa TaxID=4217 RepID=A0ACB9A018_ARCLA|nr:hypothetical protein L6452_27049 [Arctium lappa]